MKGLVCTIEKDKYNDKGDLVRETFEVLCISEVHNYGVCIAHKDGTVDTVPPDKIKIIPPNHIQVSFDDWRVMMGLEVWNQ